MDKGAESYRVFLNGDEAGLIEIVRLYSDGLYLFLYQIVGNTHEAEDLTEETFAKLCLKRPKYRGEASFKTWLYTIARNLAVDRLRKEKKYLLVPPEDAAAMADAVRGANDPYEANEKRMILRTAMQRLNPDHAQVLTLIYLEDLSIKDTARVMSRSVHAIENLNARAKAALRRELEKEGYPDEEL